MVTRQHQLEEGAYCVMGRLQRKELDSQAARRAKSDGAPAPDSCQEAEAEEEFMGTVITPWAFMARRSATLSELVCL